MPFKMIFLACWLMFPAGPLAAADEASASTAVLELEAAGLVLKLPGRKPQRFAGLRELLEAYPGLGGRFQVEKAVVPAAGRIEPDQQEKRNQPVDLLAGSASALELLQVLADYTGLPIVHDSSDKALEAVRVPFTSDVKGADYAVIKAHLEAAGLRIRERKLPGGKRLIEVAAGQSRPRPLKSRPIIVVGREKLSGGKIQRRRRVVDSGRPAIEDYMGLVLTRVPEVVRAQLPITSREGVLALDVDRNLTQLRGDLRLLERYDVITSIGRHPVSTPEAMVEELNRFSKGDEFTLRLYRKGSLKIYRVKR